MDQWRYRGAALIGLLGGALVFLFLSWAGLSEVLISRALLQLNGAALAGALVGCAVAFVQRKTAHRASLRLDRTRQIRIARSKGD
jgi:hypothetical protein